MDQKVSELTQATGVTTSDLLYLVQSGVSKSVSIETLLANLPLVLGAQGLSLTGIPDALGSAGSISLTKSITVLTGGANSYTASLGTPSNALLKILVCDSASNPITISGVFSGFTSLELRAAGDSAILIYIGSAWYLLGGRNYTQ